MDGYLSYRQTFTNTKLVHMLFCTLGSIPIGKIARDGLAGARVMCLCNLKDAAKPTSKNGESFTLPRVACPAENQLCMYVLS